VSLSRSGFTASGADTWRCTWNNPGATEDKIALATAICLQPPSYGPDPLADRIVRVTKSSSVLASAFGTFAASCAPGDFLVTGSCMLDSDDPSSREVYMYHHGFDAQDPNAWRCAWSNPTTLTFPATATAICLTP
jgi:hypothetical protein